MIQLPKNVRKADRAPQIHGRDGPVFMGRHTPLLGIVEVCMCVNTLYECTSCEIRRVYATVGVQKGPVPGFSVDTIKQAQ